ncbi:DUF4232 domain-containing protein [Streptomyces gamaensis]|uniref:DUF4232 domain-containing protein n=1 Tax=Streptomyces gamaensis TaxID=1763542 RepID=A0ABW0YY78_9ACTN
MRTSRLIASAALAAAALSATACGSGVAADHAGAPQPSAPVTVSATPSTATGNTAASATPGAKAGGHTGSAAPARTGHSAKPSRSAEYDPATVPACTAANSKVTVQSVPRPLNHLALTLTNTSDKLCAAYYHPLLRFDAAQAATPVFDDSVPQAVVTLEPGQSAYAGVRTSSADGSGENGRDAGVLTVHFMGRDAAQGGAGGSVGTPARLKLPHGTYVDDKAAVTYWQTDAATALSW